MSDPTAAPVPPLDPKRLNEAQKERIKLSANFMNSVAVAVFAIGGLAPLFSYIYGSMPQVQSPFYVIFISLCCAIGGVSLHLAARHVLKGLSP